MFLGRASFCNADIWKIQCSYSVTIPIIPYERGMNAILPVKIASIPLHANEMSKSFIDFYNITIPNEDRISFSHGILMPCVLFFWEKRPTEWEWRAMERAIEVSYHHHFCLTQICGHPNAWNDSRVQINAPFLLPCFDSEQTEQILPKNPRTRRSGAQTVIYRNYETYEHTLTSRIFLRVMYSF